jgi:hypothetical protein
MDVTLSEVEYLAACQTGLWRRILSRARGSTHTYGYQPSDHADELEGAAAEMAYAKHLHVYYDHPVDQAPGEADVAGADVKWTRHRNGGLIFRNGMREDRVYVLVTGGYGRYRIHGTATGAQVKRDGEWREGGNGRPGFWLLPQTGLTPAAVSADTEPRLFDG